MRFKETTLFFKILANAAYIDWNDAAHLGSDTFFRPFLPKMGCLTPIALNRNSQNTAHQIGSSPHQRNVSDIGLSRAQRSNGAKIGVCATNSPQLWSRMGHGISRIVLKSLEQMVRDQPGKNALQIFENQSL